MRAKIKYTLFVLIINFFMIVHDAKAQRLDDFKYKGHPEISENTIQRNFQFNGYATISGSSSDHWWNDYRIWSRYGNFFKISMPDIEKKIAQSKIDIAEDLNIPGLWMQEGFLNDWMPESVRVLDNPGLNEIETAVSTGEVLILVDPASESGKMLMSKYPGNNKWREVLKSYQYNDPGLIRVDAFMLESGNRKIFVIASTDHDFCLKTVTLLENVKMVVTKYDLHKGWFGVETLLKSVTCTPGHPIDIIGKGMNEGNDWFVFNGYMEYLAKDEIKSWIARTKMSIVTDVGSSPIFGLDDYDGLKVQDKSIMKDQVDFAHKKNGYIFNPVWPTERATGRATPMITELDTNHYDGYLAIEANKPVIDNENVPFVISTGNLLSNLLNSMILFTDKGEKFTRKEMWKAIMDKQEIAVLGEGVIMGPAVFRTAIQMLMLDRVFLENYYGDRIDLNAEMDGYNLRFTLDNTYAYPVNGKVNIQLPEGVLSDENLSPSVTIPANSKTIINLTIRPDAKGMNTANPIVAGFEWGNNEKFTMCAMDMPPAISVNKLLYGQTPLIKYPVTVHNFTKETSYPVTVRVYDKNKPGKVLFSSVQQNFNPTGTFKELIFDLKLPAGSYDVEVAALGVKTMSQLGVGKATGSARAYEVDLNSDGVNEYRLENDSVQIILLRTGARVIEYNVKSRNNDNVFFKLWPEKTGDDKRPNRLWQFYPYGGFEDFLGQASMETHKVYDAELIKSKGAYVQVKMVADFYGNKLEKIFTLYGNSPLLEIRYALTFKNPEANMIGPQPQIELGKSHGPEDEFFIPAMEGLEKFQMRPESSYGRAIVVKEGWYAGYDTKEDISFIGAFPVDQPIFLHMWMNHSSNAASHYFYCEMQPWTPIYQKSIMYFTCYLWGAGGQWELSLQELRKRNLISTRKPN